MQLYLYKNFAKCKNETKRPDLEHPDKKTNFVLKRETSYSHPVVTIESADYPQYTYAYIEELNRYYFIGSTKQSNRNMYDMELHVDPLATCKAGIALYNCYIERTSDSRYINSDMPDDAVSVEDMIEHTNSATTPLFTTEGNYILRMIGRDTSGVATFVFHNMSSVGGVFNPVFSELFDEGGWGDLKIGDLVQALLCDPKSYVLGAYYSPVPLGDYITHGENSDVYMGFYKTDVRGTRITSPILTKDLTLAKPSSIYSDFRKTDPAFSQYTMYLPAIGTVTLSPDVMDGTLTLNVSVDLLTGDIFYKLNSSTTGLVATYSGKCYAPLQIGNGDASGGTALITALANTVGEVAKKDIVGSVAGTFNSIKAAMVPTPSVNGSQGGIASMAAYPDVIFSIMQKSSGEFPINQVGRPCCKNLTIGNMSGFIKCGAPSISLAVESDILDAVNEYLANGFYYT